MSKSQDFVTMCATGFGCGLKTLGESFNNMANHYDLFWKIEEANEKIGLLAKEIEAYPDGYNTTVKEAMGTAWVDAEIAAEKAFWEQQEALREDHKKLVALEAISQDPHEMLTFGPLEEPVVDGEDWELGPACGLDPEVCESCT